MRVRIDDTGQHQQAGRVDDVGVARDALADFGDFPVADEDIGVPLTIGGDHRSAANQHGLSVAAESANPRSPDPPDPPGPLAGNAQLPRSPSGHLPSSTIAGMDDPPIPAAPPRPRRATA